MMDEIVTNVTEIVINVNENITNFEQCKDETSVISRLNPVENLFTVSLMLFMAVLPIIIGSNRSINHLKNKEKHESSPEVVRRKDVVMIPILASIVLFSFYLIFKFLSEKYVNLLISSHMAISGDAALYFLLRSVVKFSITNKKTKEKDNCSRKNDFLKVADISLSDIDSIDIVCFLMSSILSLWYVWQKHWVANNVFALAFAIVIIETIHLNTISNGLCLLGGLFVFDIFWVYGTDVMKTVALTLDAPNKLLIPRDILTEGFRSKYFNGFQDFTILGLGDIIIPGLFIALLLRFDKTLERKSNSYFLISFIGYVFGLVMTTVVSAYFRSGQPALLFLVPPTVTLPAILAAIKGDSKMLYGYRDDHLLMGSRAIRKNTNLAEISDPKSWTSCAATSSWSELTDSTTANDSLVSQIFDSTLKKRN